MANVNRATLIGHLGQDVELKTGKKSGKKIARLRIATTYKPKEGEPETTWHSVTCFGKTAESAAKYLHKGSRVWATGRIRVYKLKGKDGIERERTEIAADEVQFLDRAPNGEASKGGAKAAESGVMEPAVVADGGDEVWGEE